MKKDDEQRIAVMMAKTLAMMCVRNTGLETLHAGIIPTTHAGDYSDVRVIDADGGRSPRTTSLISIEDPELKETADR